jgi:hypothetical protein
MWATGQSGGAPDMHCSLSGTPSDACSDSARAGAHCSVSLFLCRRLLALVAVAPLGTPDSSVNYSVVALRISEGGKFESISLVHRTLSGGTPDCPVRQTRAAIRLSFALFI